MDPWIRPPPRSGTRRHRPPLIQSSWKLFCLDQRQCEEVVNIWWSLLTSMSGRISVMISAGEQWIIPQRCQQTPLSVRNALNTHTNTTTAASSINLIHTHTQTQHTFRQPLSSRYCHTPPWSGNYSMYLECSEMFRVVTYELISQNSLFSFCKWFAQPTPGFLCGWLCGCDCNEHTSNPSITPDTEMLSLKIKTHFKIYWSVFLECSLHCRIWCGQFHWLQWKLIVPSDATLT